jgi:hypothetical protein
MSSRFVPIQNVTRFIPITFSGANFLVKDEWQGGVLHCVADGTITAIDTTGVECAFEMTKGQRVLVSPQYFKLGATGSFQYHI